MRIRHFPSTSTLVRKAPPPQLPSVRLSRGDTGPRFVPHGSPVIPPTASSPRYPLASTVEDGLFKYKTGSMSLVVRHSDGTLKMPLDAKASCGDHQRTISAPDTGETSAGHGDLKRNILSSAMCGLALTDSTKQKLGLAVGVVLNCKTKQMDVDHALIELIEPSHMAREIERYCETVEQRGVACSLSSMDRMHERFPTLDKFVLTAHGATYAASWHDKGQSRQPYYMIFHSHLGDPNTATPHLRVSIPGFGARTKLDDGTESQDNYKMFVDLRSPRRSNSEQTMVRAAEITWDDAAHELAETAYTVITKLSEGMTFAKRASIPALFSEAVLRTLGTEIFAAEVVRVGFDLGQASLDEPRIAAETLWRERPAVLDEENLAPASTTIEPDWWTQHAMGTLSPSEFDAALAATDAHRFHGTPARGVYRTAENNICIAGQNRLKSTTLERKAGVSHYGYMFHWTPERASGMINLSPDHVEKLIKTAAVASANQGMECLRHILLHLVNTLPKCSKGLVSGRTFPSLLGTEYASQYALAHGLAVRHRANNTGSPIELSEIHTKIGFPVIRGFATSSSLCVGWIRVILRGTLTGKDGHGVEQDVLLNPTEALGQIIKAVEPLFKTVGREDLNDAFAEEVVQTLCRSYRSLGNVYIARAEVRVGSDRGATGTGRAVFGKSEDEHGNLPLDYSSSFNQVTGSPEAPAEAHAGADRSPAQAEVKRDGNVEVGTVTRKGSEADAERQVPLAGYGSATTEAGVVARLERSIKSSVLSDRTGLLRVGATVIWPAHDIARILPLSHADIGGVISQHLAIEDGTGLPYLLGVAQSVQRSLPLHPTIKLDVGGSFNVVVTVGANDHTTSIWDAPVKIASRQIPHLYWSHVGVTRRCWVVLIAHGQICARDEESCDPAHPDGFATRADALERLLREVFADSKSAPTPEALLDNIASAISKSTTIFPEDFAPDRIVIKLAESGAGSSTSLGTKEILTAGLEPSRNDTSLGGVFVALGSNVGDRFGMIEAACGAIDNDADMRILRTSQLYETKPMYIENQEPFLNGVCELKTSLQPLDLLERLQAIEQRLGRVKTIEKGPRNIDLDILLYRYARVQTERLVIPHALMTEREFVLRPLRDIGFQVPRSVLDVRRNLSRVESRPLSMFSQVPLGPDGAVIRATDPKHGTRVMSILNVTPDSFSDGGAHLLADLERLKTTVTAHIAAGATIIDIGGQSSRPKAPDITAEEEIARILPAIQAIKDLGPKAEGLAISIDTYRASVASAAIEAGAHIINDISAGLLDPDMLPTIARLGCTYVMMHMRGTPATMQDDEHTSYPYGLIPTVARELRARLKAAQEAGIRRWRIILDPGVGFAKTQEQNLELLKRLEELKNWAGLKNMPWLVGSSRKGFIGKITGVEEAKDRTWGTAATVTAAVQGGADIVRVHDVAEMAQVVKMADAMYRV